MTFLCGSFWTYLCAVVCGFALGAEGVSFLKFERLPDSSGKLQNQHAAGTVKNSSRLTHWGSTESATISAAEKQRRALLCDLKQSLSGPASLYFHPVGLQTSIPAHGTCAVVSNSGALVSHSHGSEIDAATAVIRFNDAPTWGFEKYVGSKETIRFGNDQFPAKVMNGELSVKDGVTYLMQGPQSVDMLRAAQQNSGSHFMVFDMNFKHLVSQALGRYYAPRWRAMGHNGASADATTGAVGMALALKMCDNVIAYEMAPSVYAQTSSYNYYEDHTIKATNNSWHSTFESEHDLWQRLSVTPSTEILQTGRAVIPGFSSIDCTGVAPPQVVAASFLQQVSDVRALIEASSLGMLLAGVLVVMLLPAMYYSFGLWRNRFENGQVRLAPHEMSPEQNMATAALVIYVLLLIASDVVASHTAQKHSGKYPWEPATVVLLVELSKLLCSLPLWAFRESPPVAENGTETRLQTSLAAFVRLVPIALLYSMNNCLTLFVLAFVKLHSYVVWRNTAIFFNALLWTYALGRTLGKHQWMAVGFMWIGCSLNAITADGSISDVVGWPALVLLLSALMSATAAAFNEAVLKTPRFSHLGVDAINIMLYSQTSTFLTCFLLGRAAWHQRSMVAEFPRLLAQLDSSAISLIVMGTLLGLTVSRVLLHANAVAKTMAGGAREILEVGIAPFFVASRLDWTSLPSAVWIAVAMVTYFVPAGTPAGDAAATFEKAKRLEAAAETKG